MNMLEILKAVNGKAFNFNENFSINNIVIDSREALKGDLFIALDGKYINDAIKKDISCFITDKKMDCDIPFIVVSDIYQSLLDLGCYVRKKYQEIPLIAITGSTGKTTTKVMLYCVLSKKYKVLKSEGNYNNHIGLPLTLFKLNDTYDVIIVELGMNHLGEIDKLSKVCLPDLSIITNIGSSHIGNLGSIKNIKKAKMEIIDNSKKTLTPFKNKSTELIKKYPIKIIKNDLYGTEFVLGKYHFKSNTPNMINNISIILMVSEIFGINNVETLSIMEKFKMPDKRMNVIDNRFILIDDCYNASYESILNGINLFKNLPNKKLIVLGDILELGRFSKKYHKKISNKLKGLKYTTILTVGSNTKYIKNAVHFNNNSKLFKK